VQNLADTGFKYFYLKIVHDFPVYAVKILHQNMYLLQGAYKYELDVASMIMVKTAVKTVSALGFHASWFSNGAVGVKLF
jgi:hypothetical protein